MREKLLMHFPHALIMSHGSQRMLPLPPFRKCNLQLMGLSTTLPKHNIMQHKVGRWHVYGLR